MKTFLTTMLIAVTATTATAQLSTTLPIDTAKQKKSRTSLSIGQGGVRVSKPDDTAYRAVEIQYGMLDFGVNSLIDNTDYASAAARSFLRVPSGAANAELFSLRQSKSVNVNIYPIMVKAKLYSGKRQQIILASGVGLQLYNFRFTKPTTYTTNPDYGSNVIAVPGTKVVLDSISFSKNKLAFNYLTVPLMLVGKTRIAPPNHAVATDDAKGKTYGNGYWLTYGVGISGGYLLSSWTKQISDERGKQKNHDPFNFSKTNLCLTGEFGLDGIIRLYASYQLTALHETALDQHPFSIGIRFLGL